MEKNKKKNKKEEVTKEVKKVVKEEKKKVTIKERLKKFFNSPQPLFVLFAIIIAILLLYISKYQAHDEIYIGTYTSDDASIANVHFFTNHKLNYFYSTPVLYDGEHGKKEVYSYNLGYYFVDNKGETHEFLVRYGDSDNKVPVRQVIADQSGFSYSELATQQNKFTNEALINLKNLHFKFIGSTTKDGTIDIEIDMPITVDQVL